MAVAPDLAGEIVQMLKDGQPPEAAHAHLLSRGIGTDEAHNYVSELLRLKQAAAALDPKRLREEAKWMLLRGAPIDDVVRHFVSAGVAEEHARPEVARIAQGVAKMRPCQRCGTPTEQGDFVFDVRGVSVCMRCNLQDEIGRSEQRGVLGELEAVGFSPLIAQAIGGAIEQSTAAPPTRPFCARCQVPSGVHVSGLRPDVRAQLHPGWSWVCAQCGSGIA